MQRIKPIYEFPEIIKIHAFYKSYHNVNRSWSSETNHRPQNRLMPFSLVVLLASAMNFKQTESLINANKMSGLLGEDYFRLELS